MQRPRHFPIIDQLITGSCIVNNLIITGFCRWQTLYIFPDRIYDVGIANFFASSSSF
jgi:hypothetical protein